MASSSPSLRCTWKYRVFASFHGPDVRQTFLTHLRKQLNDNGITMFDDQKIVRGDSIGPALTQAIGESRISIVVLSKNYASSRWCLDELLEILKCEEKIGQIVLTIFHGVDPSDVRQQTGQFGIAFNDTCAGKTEEKRSKWSQALKYVGNIAGEHFQKRDNESKMIEKIARDVSDKLNGTISRDFEDMVGIKAHLQKMQSLLHLEHDGAMIVGICGPAGIGKTTIARALHHRLSNSFQFTCFMENLRGSYNSGLDEYVLKESLQEKLLSKILNQKKMKINHLGAVPEWLCDKKVLIILDDVDDLKQLEALADETNWFGPGSRIIVTTEDRELLEKHDINNTYHVAFPTDEEARMIFCRYAFRKSLKPDCFEKLIERVTELCSKLPLGLRVMGSYLCKKTKDDWEDILQRLENSLDPIERDIERVLRVGYESITKQYQLLFLFIAFFFNYENVDHVKDMLTESKLNVRLGLKTLENKSLIQISTEGNIVVMHKLLQQMGREVVQRQDPRKRQILIDSDEICDVLENESDCTSVMGISFDISTIPNGVRLSARALKRMNNLRFLRIYNNTSLDDTNVRVHVPEDMDFPHRLKLLHWDAYPLKCLPPTFRPEFIVELNLRDTKLEKLWEGIQPLPHLKKMNLFESMNLKELPDLSKAENLEQLELSFCKSLVELPPSIASLHKLERLKMDFCEKLQVVPTHFNLASLHQVSMWGCNQWRNIPDIARNITELEITDTMLEEVPDSIRFCRLKCLGIYGTSNGSLDIEKIPDWIKDLHQLEELSIRYCPKLASLTELPASLERLTVETCKSLETLIPFPGDSPIIVLFFLNCFKLDRKARRVITQQSWDACLPGFTIPAKFNQQALGNSLTIRSDFHFFRICVLVSPNERMDDDDWKIIGDTLLCHVRINGCPIETNIDYEVSRIDMEHLYMSCILFSDKDEGWREQDNEILFEFSTTSPEGPELDIIQCGVQTLTDEPVISYESSSEDLSEDDDESLSDGSNESDEPIVKRLKT